MIGALFILGAMAQELPDAPALDLQRWSAPPDGRGTLWTWDAADAPRGWASAGTAVGWQRAPVVYRYDDGESVDVVERAFQTSVLGAWSAGRVLVGAELPLLLGVRGEDIDTPAALGDASLAVKGVLLDHRAPVGLAVLGRLRAPTAAGAGTTWAPRSASYELGLVADVDLGPALLAVNLGTRGQSREDFGDFVVDDAFSARLGAAWRPAPPLSLGVDLVADVPWESGFSDVRALPAEGLLNASLRLGERWSASVGGGRGLTSGVGSPDLRVVAMIRHDPERSWDEVLEVEPAAFAPPSPPVEVPPPPEPPRTGSLELIALTPDQERVLGASWRVDGRAMAPMQDGVGEAELPVGTAELEVSAPGYVTARFPVQIEPGENPPLTVTLRLAKVEVTRDRLVITEKIYFDTNRATIRPESFALLDEIASVLLERADILSLRIEGHTDSRGTTLSNQTLSEQRAVSVRDYLIRAGVDASRLSAFGFGESKPLDDRELSAAWDLNRRVEFLIERWAP